MLVIFTTQKQQNMADSVYDHVTSQWIWEFDYKTCCIN